MLQPENIRISDYDYDLPGHRIALHPPAERDASKLLVCRNGSITDSAFSRITDHLPDRSILVFNDTRVIRARILFRKPTGGQIEVFCLEPLSPVSVIGQAFEQRSPVTWKCLVGNRKRWKSGPVFTIPAEPGATVMEAQRAEDLDDGCSAVRFSWDSPGMTFGELLEQAGRVPLPPYITREAEPSDIERYQTVFAARDGSVAAPTAGLHFTPAILDNLAKAGMDALRVTLHVGVGTFRPVSTDLIGDHVMHSERIAVGRKVIEQLLAAGDRPVIAIGTTSARTIESLYWAGARMAAYGEDRQPSAGQWTPYGPDSPGHVPASEALGALITHMERHKLDEISFDTSLMIAPGYRFRLLSGLFTNFHMPRSTLLLLVAALVGDDWRKVYEHALAGEYRFLSYGDACLFLKG